MDIKEYIQRQFKAIMRFSDGVTADLTEEQVNWTPPGTANSIGVALLHTLNSEDRRLQADIQGKPTIFESGGWRDKFGIDAPGAGGSWEVANRTHISLANLLGYQEAVRASTREFMASATVADLERLVAFRGEQQPVAHLIAVSMAQTAHHVGEASVLKGLQGAKGIPF